MIVLLTAPVRSGKTTSLIKWAQQNEVQGILTPDVNGKRVFMDAETNEQWAMEAAGNKETLLIGRFAFSKEAFEKAIQVIRDSIHKKGWLIIDEIGPLELRGEGFHDILKELLDKRKEKILLVVREGLAQQVIGHFKLNAMTIHNTENL